MNIALLGFGTVGSHFYKLCEGRTDLHVAAVLSRRPRPELTCTVTADYDEIVRDPSIDIVVEVMGGIEPAYSYLCAAMRAGKHVVTANKQLMCAHFEELTSLAKEKGVALRCTAAAGGGIPWLTSLSRASELDEIKAVEGILNGTTNYMLSAMTNSGADYAPALRKAQELGYAEADPTADVEGLDARRKIVLSADLAFGVNIREEDIPCVGISSITAGDIAKAKDEGLTYKLIARAEKNGRAVAAFVCPTLFPSSAPEAHTDGTGNVKGCIDNPLVELPAKANGHLDVGTAVGKDGVLTVIRDNRLQKEPTVGQVPLVSGEIAEDLTSYYAYSEQVPTVMALGVLVDKDLSVLCAGGFMVQLLPGATDAEIDQLEKNISAMPSVTELLHAGKTPEDMMQMALAGFAPNVLDERTVQYQCDCSAERTKEMLLSLGRAELVRMRDEDPTCEVVCHFCHSKYQYDLNALIAEYDAQAAEAEHPIQ